MKEAATPSVFSVPEALRATQIPLRVRFDAAPLSASRSQGEPADRSDCSRVTGLHGGAARSASETSSQGHPLHAGLLHT